MGEQLDIFLSKWLSYGFNVSKKAIPSVINKIKAFYFGNESIADEQKLLKLDEVSELVWSFTVRIAKKKTDENTMGH